MRRERVSRGSAWTQGPPNAGEPDATITISILEGTGYSVGNPSAASVSVIEPPAEPKSAGDTATPTPTDGAVPRQILGGAPAPTGVSASGISRTSIRVSWISQFGVEFYWVERLLVDFGGPGDIWGGGDDDISATSYDEDGLSCSTNYRFRVRGRGDGGFYDTFYSSSTGTSGSTHSCPGAAPAPANFRVTATDQTTITLGWNSRTGVVQYQLTLPGGSTTTLGGSTTSDTYTGVCNTNYSFQLSGRGDGSTYNVAFANSSSASGKTDACPDPPAPQNLRKQSATRTSITVAWDRPAGTSNSEIGDYKVGGSGLTAQTPGNTTFTETFRGLDCNTSYSFWVQAKGTGSPYSTDYGATDTGSFSTSACRDPVPTIMGFDVVANAATRNSITVQWNSLSKVTYKVDYSTKNQSNPPSDASSVSVGGTSGQATKKVDGLTCGLTYYFWIRGKGKPGNSDYVETYNNPSGPESGNTLGCPEAGAPQEIEASADSQTEIIVSWKNDFDVAKYKVERKNGTSDVWTVEATVSPTHLDESLPEAERQRTSLTVSGLTCGTSYKFRVSAKGDGSPYASGDFGATSDEEEASTTALCTPQGLTITPLVQRKARLTWEAVANATRYEVDAYRVGEIGGWQPLPRSGAGLGMLNDEAIPTHEFELDRIIGAWGLDDNDAFKFHVRAIVTGHATDMIFSKEITLVDSPILSVNGDSTGRSLNDGKMVVKWAWDADYAQHTYTIRYRKLPDNHDQIPMVGMAGWQPDSAANDMAWSAPPSVQPTPTRGVSLEYPITGLEQYKVYAVQLNYTTPTNTYFSAREAYVWPSNRAAGNGERVATFPLNHPLSELTDETYRYRICLSTFSSDMNKQDAWKTFIEHALDQWELATNGLVTMTYTPGSCADYSEILNDVHEEVKNRLMVDLTPAEDRQLRKDVREFADMLVTWTEISRLDRVLNEISVIDIDAIPFSSLKSVKISAGLAKDLGFATCILGDDAAACASRNPVTSTTDILLKRSVGSAYQEDPPALPTVKFNSCTTGETRDYRHLVHESGHALGIRSGNDGAGQFIHHPTIAGSVMSYEGRPQPDGTVLPDDPDCSPHPADILAIFVLYQTR